MRLLPKAVGRPPCFDVGVSHVSCHKTGEAHGQITIIDTMLQCVIIAKSHIQKMFSGHGFPRVHRLIVKKGRSAMPRPVASHLMASRTPAIRTMVAGAFAALVSGTAMAESIGRVCLAPSNTAGQVILIASTGCQSAGRGFRYEDVDIRRDGGDVYLTGGFHYAKRGVRQRDCMDTIPDPLPPPQEWPVVYPGETP